MRVVAKCSAMYIRSRNFRQNDYTALIPIVLTGDGVVRRQRVLLWNVEAALVDACLREEVSQRGGEVGKLRRVH